MSEENAMLPTQAPEVTIVVRVNAPGVEKTATRIVPLQELMHQQEGPLYLLNGAFASALGQVLPELF